MKIIAATIAVILLTCSGCSPSTTNNGTTNIASQPSSQNMSQPLSSSTVAATSAMVASTTPEGEMLPPATIKTPSSNAKVRKIYAEFQKDITGCVNLIRVMGTDEDLMKSIRETRNPEAYTAELLQKSKISTTPEVKRILTDIQYFVIGVTYEREPFAVAWVADRDIFCAPTMVRMKEAESFGESEEGWWMRSFFMTRAWAYLPDPASVSGSGTESSWVEELINQASSIYTDSQRGNFVEWIDKTIKDVKQQRAQNEISYRKEKTHEAGMTLDAENREFDERIAFLSKFAKKEK